MLHRLLDSISKKQLLDDYFSLIKTYGEFRKNHTRQAMMLLIKKTIVIIVKMILMLACFFVRVYLKTLVRKMFEALMD